MACPVPYGDSLIRFDRRTFPILLAALRSAVRSEYIDSQLPHLIIQRSKSRLGELVRRSQFRLKAGNAGQRTLKLVRGKCFEAAERCFDCRNAMANHGEVVAGLNRPTNGIFEAVLVED